MVDRQSFLYKVHSESEALRPYEVRTAVLQSNRIRPNHCSKSFINFCSSLVERRRMRQTEQGFLTWQTQLEISSRLVGIHLRCVYPFCSLKLHLEWLFIYITSLTDREVFPKWHFQFSANSKQRNDCYSAMSEWSKAFLNWITFINFAHAYFTSLDLTWEGVKSNYIYMEV